VKLKQKIPQIHDTFVQSIILIYIRANYRADDRTCSY